MNEMGPNDFDKIANMTNKEAAAIIKDLLLNTRMGRANGKTIMVATVNTALIKAVAVLEKMPD